MSDGGPILSPLGKVYDGEHPTRERDEAADDVADIILSDIQGRSEVGDLSRKEMEDDIRAERLFFEAVSNAVSERCRDWLGRRFRISHLPGQAGYMFSAADKEGRQFEVSITYSEFSEVAERQRKAEKNLTHMADEVVRRISVARDAYHRRLRAIEVGDA